MLMQEFTKQLEQRNFPLIWPGQWVAGKWLPVGRGSTQKSSFNPNNGQKLMDVLVDKESIGQAIEFAYGERTSIAALNMSERMDILQKFRQALVDYQQTAELVLRLEAGKPKWEASEDIRSSANYLDWVINHGESMLASLTTPLGAGPHRGVKAELLPIGVTAAYLPFSTPMTSFVYYFAASVLAGCPLILNSSTHALLSSLLIALLAQQQNIPAAVLQVVFGNFSSFKQLIGDKRISAVLYTGTREHCDLIRQEARGQMTRQTVLQSGGKNAVIVHSSANIDQAVRCVLYGALKTAGQRCTSTSRVFVYRSLLNEFCEAATSAFKSVKIGRTDVDDAGKNDDHIFMGPLYSEKALEKYLRFQTMANREAENTLLWGRAMNESDGGYFVSPSLHYLSRFDNSTAYQGNLLFSPDVAIYDYDVLDTAIEQINTTDAAFAVSFIGDPSVLEARRRMFLAPNLMLNTPTVEIEATLPLGGRLQSGHHRFHGPGIALYLCYPQVVAHDPNADEMIRTWPWSGI